MASEIITRQELVDAKADAESLQKFISGTDIEDVLTRLGQIYPTLAKLVRILMETGGWKAYQTETILLATTPTVNPSVGYAFDTKKLYRWNGTNWTDEGVSPLDLSKQYTDQKAIEVNTNIEGILVNEVLPYIDNADDIVKADAINAAAMDATTKADTAEENAKNYADSNANFTFKVLTETDHLDDLKVSGTYTALNTIVASTSRGYPVNEAGALRVVKHSNSNSTQHEYLTFSGKLYIRRFIASWSAWVAQATSAETDAAKAENMGVALVNRGVVTGSAITNLTDVG
ncbi:pyocin knob domain-containing protein, partial [Acinetobacter baumannii]|nr:pyocin knob domain-containing protein [Acinetobacter baumannii]